MYIQDDELRKVIKKMLKHRTKYSIVNSIQKNGEKFQQLNLDNFLAGKPITLDTIKKLDRYATNNPL